MTEMSDAPTAYRRLTPNTSVNTGTRMTPPPSPVNAPMRPAATEAHATSAANAALEVIVSMLEHYGDFFFSAREPSALSGLPSAVACVVHHAGDPTRFGSFCSSMAFCGTFSLTSPAEVVVAVAFEEDFGLVCWASNTAGQTAIAAARPRSLIVIFPPSAILVFLVHISGHDGERSAETI